MSIGQYTIEKKQEQYLLDDQPSNSGITSALCAWCLSEQGVAAGEGSHGICKKHADSFVIQWREHRSRHVTNRAYTS
jgi:hypothetical protein